MATISAIGRETTLIQTHEKLQKSSFPHQFSLFMILMSQSLCKWHWSQQLEMSPARNSCESINMALHLLCSFLGSLVKNRRAPHQGVGRMWGVATVGRCASRRGCYGSSGLAHGGHGLSLLKHISTQDTVVMVVVVMMAGSMAFLAILWLHFDLWPQWRVVGPAPSL